MQDSSSSLPEESHGMHLIISPAMSCANMCEVLCTGKAQCSGLLLGADHVGTLCLPCANILASKKESRCSL